MTGRARADRLDSGLGEDLVVDVVWAVQNVSEQARDRGWNVLYCVIEPLLRSSDRSGTQYFAKYIETLLCGEEVSCRKVGRVQCPAGPRRSQILNGIFREAWDGLHDLLPKHECVRPV